jgi:hypothetical protein
MRYSILREFENIVYKVMISYKTQNSNMGIIVELCKEGEEEVILADHFITFEKLKSISSKIQIYNALPSLADLSSIITLDSFIERIFIYFTLITSKSGKLSVNIVSRPVGICNSIYEFSFLKSKCYIDFIILPNETSFFMNSCDAENKFIKLNIDLDESSFKTAFRELYNTKQLDNEISVRNYTLSDAKHLNKNGFVPYIMIKLQEIFRIRFNEQGITFDALVDILQNCQVKLRIENELSLFSLWLLNISGEDVAIDFFTLNRIFGKIYF